jgi:hypothetical protein
MKTEEMAQAVPRVFADGVVAVRGFPQVLGDRKQSLGLKAG